MAACPFPVREVAWSPGSIEWSGATSRSSTHPSVPVTVAHCSTGLSNTSELANLRSSAVVAIAAGNDGEDLEDVRCSKSGKKLCQNPDRYFGHVLVVGALKSSKKLAGFSNRPGNACFPRKSNGSCEHRLKHWFLVAPGVAVKSPLPGNRYAKFDGTSAAAPIVSGGAALIMSQWPPLKAQPEEVARILLESADDLGKRASTVSSATGGSI
jgi:subtilisin family serine protease